MSEVADRYAPPKRSWVSKLFGKRAPEKPPILDLKSSQVWLSSNAYLTKEKAEWLPHYFSGLSLLQAIEAQARANNSIPLLGGKEHRSQHPRLGPRRSLDDMLYWEIDIRERGKAKSTWIGTGEFEGIVDRWCRSDTAFGIVHNDGVHAHTPFGDNTASLRIMTDQPHARLGSGLIAMLHIPVVSGDPREAAATCVSLNYLEGTVWSKLGVPFIGNWYASESQDSSGTSLYAPTFQCFIPNMMYRLGIAENFTMYMLARARWARQTLWPTVVDSSMDAIASRRLNIAVPT